MTQRMHFSLLVACAALVIGGCGDDTTTTDGGTGSDSGTDVATTDTGGTDAAGDTASGDTTSSDSAGTDATPNRFVALCGLPATVDMTDDGVFGRTASIHYTEPSDGIEEACDIASGAFDGIPHVRFVYFGEDLQAEFRSDWQSDDVPCPDGEAVTITADSSFDDRQMIFTVTADYTANTVTVSAFNVTDA